MDFPMGSLCVTDNILQDNLSVILPPVEMTAVPQVHEIMHIDIGLTIQCFTAKTHELWEYIYAVLFMV